jgi:hypothetical protein
MVADLSSAQVLGLIKLNTIREFSSLSSDQERVTLWHYSNQWILFIICPWPSARHCTGSSRPICMLVMFPSRPAFGLYAVHVCTLPVASHGIEWEWSGLKSFCIMSTPSLYYKSIISIPICYFTQNALLKFCQILYVDIFIIFLRRAYNMVVYMQ